MSCHPEDDDNQQQQQPEARWSKVRGHEHLGKRGDSVAPGQDVCLTLYQTMCVSHQTPVIGAGLE